MGHATGSYYAIEYGDDLALWVNGVRGWHSCHDFRSGQLEITAALLAVAEDALRHNDYAVDIPMPVVSGPQLTLRWRPGGRTDGVVECHCGTERASSTLLLCGVARPEERAATIEFNRFARADRRLRYSEGTPTIYSLKERPLCLSLYHIEKNDPRYLWVMLTVKAFAVAYFRSRFVA